MRTQSDTNKKSTLFRHDRTSFSEWLCFNDFGFSIPCRITNFVATCDENYLRFCSSGIDFKTFASSPRANKKNLFMLMYLILFVMFSLLCSGCDSLDYEEEETFSYADYKEIEVRQLVKSLDVNPAAAAKLFEGQNLKIIGGRIENIDANGTQFSLNGGEIFINSIVCTVEEDSHAQQQLLNLAHGQPVVIYGIVDRVENITNMNEIFSNPSHIGDLYGLVISVVKIDDLKMTSTNAHAVKDPKI